MKEEKNGEETFVIPQAVILLMSKYMKIEKIEGEVERVFKYGGAIVVKFKNGNHYKIDLQKWQPAKITTW